jgi:hypothetical protein
VLNEIYKISKYSCRKIPEIQSYKQVYYFHPISQKDEDPKLKKTKETRLTISKGINQVF